MSDNITNYAIAKFPKDIVPASPLDNVLAFKVAGKQIVVKYYSFLDGRELTLEKRPAFNKTVQNLIEKKLFPTTDHLFVCVTVGEYVFLYVSLDNSRRSNSNGFPLMKRLNELCRVVKNAIEECGNKCVIFFSESSRPSFEGNDFNNRINEVTWFQIRRIIENSCGLEYLGECQNNDDPMSFGVSAFCTPNFVANIHTVLPRRIWTEECGSGAVGIKLNTGGIIWGIHFPLDFKGIGPNNQGAKAMTGLCKVLDSYIGSVCAIGDFNTIPGNIDESIRKVIPDNKEFLVKNEITFFGSFYDTVPNTGEWTLL